MADFLSTALNALKGAASVGSSALAGPLAALAPVAGGIFSNVLSGINQRSARAWEEDMYNKYNSPSALVRQYDEAGINPALMFGGQTPAAPTDTAAAPVSDMQTGTVTEMLAQLMQLDLLDSEKRIKRASANKLEAETAAQELKNTLDRQFAEIERRYNIAEVIARVNKYEEDVASTRYDYMVLGPFKKALLRAQANREDMAAAIDKWRSEYMQKFDADPDKDPITQALTSFVAWLNGDKPPKYDNNLPGGKDSPVTIPDYGVK